MQKQLRDDRGFTLLEMVIVVAIIGILMLIALPNYRGAAEKAQKQSCDANKKIIAAQYDQYYIERHVYPDNIDQLVDTHYLQEKPACPAGGTYSVILPGETGNTGISVLVNCSTAAHQPTSTE